MKYDKKAYQKYVESIKKLKIEGYSVRPVSFGYWEEHQPIADSVTKELNKIKKNG